MGGKFSQLLLSGNCLIPPSYLNDNRSGYSILGSRPFRFIALSISCHSLLACKVSVVKSDDNLMGFPLYVTFFLSLAAFNTLSLSLIFAFYLLCVLVLTSLDPVSREFCAPP